MGNMGKEKWTERRRRPLLLLLLLLEVVGSNSGWGRGCRVARRLVVEIRREMGEAGRGQRRRRRNVVKD